MRIITAFALALLSVASLTQAEASRRVVFDSHGHRLVGDLYLPANRAAGVPLPAVIVTGAWTTVKEQMPRGYAIEMANRGYAALAFDFRNWGQSEGERRQYEHPELKTEDIVAAAAFLAELPEIDAERIGGLGICASSGYMAGAAAVSPHLRSVALVAPWMHNAEVVDQVYGGPDGVAALIEAGQAADRAFHETGASIMRVAASDTDTAALMHGVPYYSDTQRGAIPEYVNEFNVASWEPWLTYDAVEIANGLDNVPVFIVHSEAAAIPHGVRAFYDRLKGTTGQHWLEGVSQFDFYDGPSVGLACDAVAQHFATTLPAEAVTPDPDTAAIKTAMESVALLADTGRFDALEDVFAEEVEVDYSDVSGQPASTMTRGDLLDGWRQLLPGFDRTRHDLRDARAEVSGDRGTGRVEVSAGHWIDDLYWRVEGRYEYGLVRVGDRWLIDRMTLRVDREAGTRQAIAAALQAAATGD